MQEQPLNGQPNPIPGAVPAMPQPLPQQPIVQQPASQPAQAGVPAPLPAAQQPGDVNAPAIADDGDLIEKEWVERVKQIVIETAHDPFLQNQQLTKLKAEYLQKRYGKVIKTGD